MKNNQKLSYNFDCNVFWSFEHCSMHCRESTFAQDLFNLIILNMFSEIHS
jgi:hypothetical protein